MKIVYWAVGVIVAILTYVTCILEGGLWGFLLGWIPAIIVGIIWPLPVAAVLVILLVMVAH